MSMLKEYYLQPNAPDPVLSGGRGAALRAPFRANGKSR